MLDFIVLGLIPGTNIKIGFIGTLFVYIGITWAILVILGMVQTPKFILKAYKNAHLVLKKIESSKHYKELKLGVENASKHLNGNWVTTRKYLLKKINSNKTYLAFKHLLQRQHSGHTG